MELKTRHNIRDKVWIMRDLPIEVEILGINIRVSNPDRNSSAPPIITEEYIVDMEPAPLHWCWLFNSKEAVTKWHNPTQ